MCIANVRSNLLSVFKAGFVKLVLVKKWLVIYIFDSKIFECADILKLSLKCFVIKKLVYLNTDFSILVAENGAIPLLVEPNAFLPSLSSSYSSSKI